MPRQIVYRGRRFDIALDTLTRPDGQTYQKEIVLHPGAVVILPLVDEHHVCLLRNFRPALNETLWEVPAGTLEPPEDPAAAAVRELAEETGYRAARWRKLREVYPSPGILSERMFLFLAEDLTPGPQRLEVDEQIVPHVIPWTQALAWAADGTIRDAKTLVALLTYHYSRP
jgi:ADP-ribose pyrophosphatase